MRKKRPILEKNYINVYSQLSSQEQRQLQYARRYKKDHPEWDETMILVAKLFGERARKFPQKIKVLDAGCGNGNYAIDENWENVSKAVGIDLAPEYTSRNETVDEIKYGHLSEIPYPTGSFEIVTSLWVLEHLEEPGKVFREIYRVLKPGGVFIFATPNKESLLLRVKRLVGNKWFINLINKVFYGRKSEDVFLTFYRANSPKEVRKLLGEAGFREVKLQLNYTPIYTSFDPSTYFLSNIIADKVHLVGVAIK